MYLSTALLSFLSFASASSLPESQHIFSNPPDVSSTGFKIPTVHESAVLARRILRLSSIGTLSTIFPSPKDVSARENRPSSVAGTPIGLMDYIADCESAGNPTVLALSIATSFKNVAAGSNISLALNWVPPPSNPPRFHSGAALPRFSLTGYLEDIPAVDVLKELVPACFLKTHPDAAAWFPGNRIHQSRWTRLVVEEVYWIGGFGDRAYIGWIPVEEWTGVTEEEIEEVRLPGEKSESNGWGSWRSWLGLEAEEKAQEAWEL